MFRLSGGDFDRNFIGFPFALIFGCLFSGEKDDVGLGVLSIFIPSGSWKETNYCSTEATKPSCNRLGFYFLGCEEFWVSWESLRGSGVPHDLDVCLLGFEEPHPSTSNLGLEGVCM